MLAPLPPFSSQPSAEAVADLDDILIHYLPGVLRQDPFMQRFLRIFDAILRPEIELIGSVADHLDPRLAPLPLVDWLASWIGEELAGRLPEEAKRHLVAESVVLHRARGTAAGLRRAVEIVSGVETLVTENTAGLRLDVSDRLGLNTVLSEAEPNSIFVILVGSAAAIDLDAVHQVIRRMIPAQAVYSVLTTEA